MNQSIKIPRPPRKYYPIWNELKTSNVCRLTAPKAFHQRIIGAVVKEKCKDEVFKFLLGERGKKAKLDWVISGNILQFKLTISLGVEDL